MLGLHLRLNFAALARCRPALFLALCATLVPAQGIITTIAGGSQFHVTGVGGPATNVPLGELQGVATDAQGNVYAFDLNNLFLVKIAPDGVLTVIANGQFGSPGGGGPGSYALPFPGGIATDAVGDVFVFDSSACIVRKIAPSGTISVVAGNGECGFPGVDTGNGGSAILASLPRDTMGIAVDLNGDLYLSDGNHIRKVNPQGVISAVAGNGQLGTVSGDGIPALSAAIFPSGLAVDRNGVIYFSEPFSCRVRRVGTDGMLTTVAGADTLALPGGNACGYSGDGGPATSAKLEPAGIAIDNTGSLYIAEAANSRIRKVTPDGMIRTIAGTGTANFTGDGGSATQATFNSPSGIAVDGSSNIFIVDAGNSRIREINSAGTITTYAGNGNYGFSGEGVPALQAVLNSPSDVLVDPSGNVYISDTGNNRIRKIAPDGIITTVAGGRAAGFAGDGGPATEALLNGPTSLGLDAAGNLYITENARIRNARIRKVDAHGIITTIADSAVLSNLSNIDARGNFYTYNGQEVERISPDGTMSTFPFAFTPPPSSHTETLSSFLSDAAGNLYASSVTISFALPSSDVDRISPDGTRTVVVAPPVLSDISAGAFDSQGALYVSDSFNLVVDRVDPSGNLIAVAGGPPSIGPPGFPSGGSPGFGGDGGPATSAQLSDPQGIAFDAGGNLYIADTGDNRIRKVTVGLVEPRLQIALQPGFYIAAVTLGQGQDPGAWGLQVLASETAGGLYLGGAIPPTPDPGFGAFFLPSAQSVHVHVDVGAAASASGVALAVQLLDASRNPVIAEQSGTTSVDFTQSLSSGFYIVTVQGGTSSPPETFVMSLGAPQFAGGFVAGGYASPTSVGFGAFYIPVPQQVTIQLFGEPTDGAKGAGGLRLTLYDVNRKIIAYVP